MDDEATGMLMRNFYEQLKKTDARTALRNAQLPLRSGTKSAPYCWAAFQMMTGSAKRIDLMAANDAEAKTGKKGEKQ